MTIIGRNSIVSLAITRWLSSTLTLSTHHHPTSSARLQLVSPTRRPTSIVWILSSTDRHLAAALVDIPYCRPVMALVVCRHQAATHAIRHRQRRSSSSPAVALVIDLLTSPPNASSNQMYDDNVDTGNGKFGCTVDGLLRLAMANNVMDDY